MSYLSLQVMCSFGSISCICVGRFVTKKPLSNLLVQHGAQKRKCQCGHSTWDAAVVCSRSNPPYPKLLGLSHHSSVHAVFQVPVPQVSLVPALVVFKQDSTALIPPPWQWSVSALTNLLDCDMKNLTASSWEAKAWQYLEALAFGLMLPETDPPCGLFLPGLRGAGAV